MSNNPFVRGIIAGRSIEKRRSGKLPYQPAGHWPKPKKCKETKLQKDIKKLLLLIFSAKNSKSRTEAVELALESFATKKKPHKPHIDMKQTTFTTEEMVIVTLAARTSTGKPAKVDGVPTWEILSGDASVKLIVSPNGMRCKIVSTDTAGTAVVRASADADLGDGFKEISLDVECTVTEPEAENIETASEISEPMEKNEDPLPDTDEGGEEPTEPAAGLTATTSKKKSSR